MQQQLAGEAKQAAAVQCMQPALEQLAERLCVVGGGTSSSSTTSTSATISSSSTAGASVVAAAAVAGGGLGTYPQELHAPLLLAVQQFGDEVHAQYRATYAAQAQQLQQCWRTDLAAAQQACAAQQAELARAAAAAAAERVQRFACSTLPRLVALLTDDN